MFLSCDLEQMWSLSGSLAHFKGAGIDREFQHKTADLVCEFACVYIILSFFSEPRSCSINMWLQSLLWTSETDIIFFTNKHVSCQIYFHMFGFIQHLKHTTHLFVT